MLLLETLFVLGLFALYLTLWAIKRASLKRQTGMEAQVMARSSSPLQRFLHALTRLLTLYAVAMVTAHAAGLSLDGVTRVWMLTEGLPFDLGGLGLGLAGLSLCLYAQIKMGSSWRVGIDEQNRTELVSTGLYHFIRNPTYLGLFILNAGLWLIWSSADVFVFGLMFWFFLEVQVRCEEEHLERELGDEYRAYRSRTKRYLPFLY